jgi:hypothetical protein
MFKDITSPFDKEAFRAEANAVQKGPFLRGITPLCLAAYLGKADLVSILLANGVAVNGCDKNGA